MIRKCSNQLILAMVMFLPAPLFALEVDVPADYDTIQEAVDALVANPSLGDTIVIAAGTYKENLEINSAIILRGEETARTLLTPELTNQAIITITDAANVTLRNLTFDTGDVGLNVVNSVNVKVNNNVFALHNQATAATFDLASSAEVVNNVFYDNENAIVRESEQIAIRNNIFSENTLAISGSGAQVEYNCFYNNNANGVNGLFAVLNANPLFADTAKLDFHLRQNSPCLNEGTGTDIIDNSVADIGAYGGEFADVTPFPVQGLVLADITTTEATPTIQVTWNRNNSYLLTHTTSPGGYKLYYDSDKSGVPYAGLDADGGNSPIDVGDVASYKLAGLSVDSVVPLTPTVTIVQPANARVTVTWSAVSGASGYQLHYGVASVNENVISVGNVLSRTVTKLTNGTSYLFAVSAKAQVVYYVALKAYDSTADANESIYSTEVSIDMGAERVSAISTPLSAIPELVVPVPDLPDEGCFIATAAFGYYSAPQVQWLRDFRDQYLKRTLAGRFFIVTYYKFSPGIAEYVRQSDVLKQAVRLALTPLVIISGLITHWQVSVFILLVVSLGLVRHVRRRVHQRLRVMA